jgi:enterochelin esterase-like enzyme
LGHKEVRMTQLHRKVPDWMMRAMKAFEEALTKAGTRHVYFESKGTAHEWQTWRRALYDFAPRLIQDVTQ